MTPLTGLTARLAAEELRRLVPEYGSQPQFRERLSTCLNNQEAIHLASLLEEGARDTERKRWLLKHYVPSSLWEDAALDAARGESKDASV